MKPFVKQSIIEPSGFKKIFFNSQKNAVIEINNLLSEKELEQIQQADITTITEKYNISDIYQKYSNELQELILQFIDEYLGKPFSKYKEAKETIRLGKLLSIPDEDIKNLINSKNQKIYAEQIDLILNRERNSNAEVTKVVDELEQILCMDKTIAQEIFEKKRIKIVTDEFQKVVSQSQISPHDIEMLDKLQEDLHVTVTLESRTKDIFQTGEALWKIENTPLAPIEVDIHLPKGECCYLKTPIDYSEIKTVTERVNYSGPAFRVKIAKRLYYKAGSIAYNKITSDQLVVVDSGVLYVTNKKLQFVGERKNIAIRYSQVLDLEIFSDAVKVVKSTGKPLYLMIKIIDSKILAATIARCLADS
ncbi:MAG: hypothetical protein KBA03_04640 [Anaerolineaceae bacterium]|nr:hypothetical protein [Anaerolineaceae bacterium]